MKKNWRKNVSRFDPYFLKNIDQNEADPLGFNEFLLYQICILYSEINGKNHKFNYFSKIFYNSIWLFLSLYKEIHFCAEN